MLLSHWDCGNLKKKKGTSHVWDVPVTQWPLRGLRSQGTRTILLFFRRADWRSLESTTNCNVWPKGNSGDQDIGWGFFSRTQESGRALKREVTAAAAGSVSAGPTAR